MLLVAGLGAAAGVLFFLAVAQLIWASSEASYYLQLTFALLLLCGICFTAKRSSKRALSAAVIATALVIAGMPFEKLAFLTWAGVFWAVGVLWLIDTFLLGIFAFAVMSWLSRPRGVSKRL